MNIDNPVRNSGYKKVTQNISHEVVEQALYQPLIVTQTNILTSPSSKTKVLIIFKKQNL